MIETTIYKCEYCGAEFNDECEANCHEWVCRYKDEQIIADVMKSGFAGSNWELARTRVDDLKDRQYHVREMEELFK